jgi:hypothetical protein
MNDVTFQRFIRINDELVNLLQLAETKGDLETVSRLCADCGYTDFRADKVAEKKLSR